MHDLELLPDASRKNLLRALEAAVQVRHRGDLFLWCLGSLNALVPHGIVLSLLVHPAQGLRAIDCLHAAPLRDEVLQCLRGPGQELPRRLAQVCQDKGACTLALDEGGARDDPAVQGLVALLRPLGVGNGLLHCTGPLIDGASAAVVLLALDDPATLQHRLMLEVLSPQIHLATLRAQEFGKQRDTAPPEEQRRLGLTERQLEILHWVKVGKTNGETAAILEVSELTVKNHLQRVFKKLDVHNRAQAVAKLMALDDALG